MKVLFATTNQAKINKYAGRLKENGIEVLTLKDLDKKIEINENGKNALENAYIKAKTAYDATKIVTIGMDNNLFIEELPEEKQPGTHVRRINGKVLNDEEMLQYYIDLVKQYGNGKLNAKWVYGMVVYDGKETKQYTWSKGHFYFIDKPSNIRTPGYPLDSISIMPEYNKYFVELTKEEKNNNKTGENDVIEFLLNSLKEEVL